MHLKDYPFESNFIEIEGYRMHYVDEGRGAPLVMLHGNPTWSYLYRHVILGLRAGCRCIAPDHIGWGMSDAPEGKMPMEDQVRRFGAFVDALGLDDITLAVQDWGGVIGLGWAVRNKERVSRLVIMNTLGFPVRLKDVASGKVALAWGLPLLWAFKISGFGALFMQGTDGLVRTLVPLGVFHKERLTDDVMRGYLYPYISWNSRKGIASTLAQVPWTPYHPTMRLLEGIEQGLEGWDAPTQIIWGTRDPVFTEFFLKRFEELLPNHRPTVRIEDASHFLQEDRPDVIVKVVAEFMETDGAEETAG